MLDLIGFHTYMYISLLIPLPYKNFKDILILCYFYFNMVYNMTLVYAGCIIFVFLKQYYKAILIFREYDIVYIVYIT